MSSVPTSGVISFGSMRSMLGKSTGVMRMSDLIQSQTNVPSSGTLRAAHAKGVSGSKAILGTFNESTQNMVTGIFSVRLINNSYLGPVVNVMRTLDNAICDFWSDFNGALKNSRGQTYTEWVGNSVGYVIIWYDQSGYARDAIGTYQCGAIPPQLTMDPTGMSNKLSVQFMNRFDPIIAVSPYFSYPPFNSSGGTAPTLNSEAGYVAFAPGAGVLSSSGSSQFYNFGSVGLTPSTTGISVSFTFMWRGPAQGWERILELNNSSNNQLMAICRYAASENMTLEVVNPGIGIGGTITTSGAFPNNTIFHVCFIYNPNVGSFGTLYVYVNGVIDTVQALTAQWNNFISTNTMIGKSNFGNNISTNMNIYSLHVWNRVLEPAEIEGFARAASYLTNQGQLLYVNPFRMTNGYTSVGGTAPAFNTSGGFIDFTPGNTTRSDAAAAQFFNYGTQTFNIGTAGFSMVCAFMFRGSSIGDWERLIDFGNGAGNQYVLVTRFTNTNQLRFVIVENGVVYDCMPNFTFLQSTLYEIACVYDPYVGSTGCMSFYVDGILRHTLVPPVKFTDRTLTNCYVGRSAFGSDRAFQGRIYFLHVYNRAITPQEVWTASRICDVIPYSGFNVFPGITDQLLSLSWRGVYPPGGVNSSNGTPPSLDVANRWFVFNPGNGVASNSSTCQYYDFGTRRFPCGTVGFTVVVEFMFTAANAWERIFDFGSGANDNNILMARDSSSNILRADLRNNATVMSTLNVTTALALNTWYRVTIVYDPTTGNGVATAYLNDVFVTSNTPAAKLIDRTLTRTFVGRSNWDVDNAFNGRIRTFQWWNKVLSLREITTAMGSAMLSYNMQSAVSHINLIGSQDIAASLFTNVSLRVANGTVTTTGGANDFMNGATGFGYHNSLYRSTSPLVTVNTGSWNTMCVSRNSGTMLFNQIGHMAPAAFVGAVTGNFNGYMNDLMVFSGSLPLTSTTSMDYVMFMKNPHIPFWRNGLVGAYFAENWQGTTGTTYPWLDISGFGQHVGTTSGTITSLVSSPVDVVGGSGMNILTGTTTSEITFPTGILPSTYTLIYITRYNGATRGRILQQASPANWISGHWNGSSGVAWRTNKWITNTNNKHGTAWMLATDQNNMLRSMTVDRTTDNVPAAPSFASGIKINNLPSESSDWAVACLIVYNRTLALTEYLTIEDQLASRYRIPVPIQEGLVMSLDAADYISGSTIWNDRSGNGYNFTVNTAAYVGTSQFPYFNFNASYATRTVSADVPFNTGFNTLIAFTMPTSSTADWRTLTRGFGADHHVLIETGTHRLGVYNNDAVAGFYPYESEIYINTLPDVYTKFNMWVFHISSTSPFYTFYYNPSSLPITPMGIITNTNANINNGICYIGGMPATNGQVWGGIGTLLWYNRKLSDQELVETYWRYQQKYSGVIQSNIQVCYTMRVKVETYTGPIIQVRRSTDNAKQDFFSDETQTFLTTAAYGQGQTYEAWILGGATGFVTIWYDQSGRSNNLINSADNNTQPRLSKQSGKWVVSFDNSQGRFLSFQSSIQPSTILCHFLNSSTNLPTITASAQEFSLRLLNGTTYSGAPLGPGFDWYDTMSGTKHGLVNGVSTTTMSLNTWTYLALSASTVSYPTGPLATVGSAPVPSSYAGQRFLTGFMTEFICHNSYLRQEDLQIYYSNRLKTVTSSTATPEMLVPLMTKARYGRISSGAVASAQGIYACWRVQDGYNGPIMTVRRSADNVLTNLYDDGNGVLVTNAGIPVLRWLSGANACVAIWFDQSGKARHATQTSISAQPVYNPITRNMVFTSAAFTCFNLPDGTVPTGNSNYTISVKHDSVNNPCILVAGGSYETANATLGIQAHSQYNTFWWAADLNAGSVVKGNMITSSYDNTVGRFVYINGNLVNSDGARNRNTTSIKNFIGRMDSPAAGNQFMNGQLYNVYLFASCLSDNERALVENSPVWMPPTSLWYAPPSYYGMSLYLDASKSESYPGSGTVWTDLSGCGNHITLTNCSYSTAFGTGAIFFNGINSMGYRSTYNMQPTSQFTAMAWVYVRGGYDGTFFTLGLTSTNVNKAVGWCLHMFFDWDGTVGFSGSLTQPSVKIATTGWYHLCFVKQGLMGTFYLNGQAMGTHFADQNVSYLSNDLCLGKDLQDNNKFLNADLVSLTMHNYGMSPGEVMNHYLSTTGGGLNVTSTTATVQQSPTVGIGNFQPYTMARVSASTRSACRAIYSFKLQNPLYTGATVQLRRDSDNNVQDFYADAYGNLGTLHMARGTTYVAWLGTASAFVRTLYDQSGNGYDLTQATNTNTAQPQFFFMSLSEESYMYMTGTKTMQTSVSVFGSSTVSNMQAFFRTREVTRTSNIMVSFNGYNGAYDNFRFFIHTPWSAGSWYLGVGNGTNASVTQTSTGFAVGDRVVTNIYTSSSENRIGLKLNQGSWNYGTPNYTANVSNLVVNMVPGGATSFTANHWFFGMFVFNTRIATQDEAFIETIPWATSQQYQLASLYRAPALTTQSYVMNNLSYSNVVGCRAIYGFRLYNPTWAGPIVEVRRSTDNTYATFFADALGNLGMGPLGTGTSLTGWLGSANGFIRVWYDQSGKSFHLVQATEANQPRIMLPTGDNPAVYLSGTSQNLACAGNIFTATSISSMHAVFMTREISRKPNALVSFNGNTLGTGGVVIHAPWDGSSSRSAAWFFYAGNQNASDTAQSPTNLTAVGQRSVCSAYKSSVDGRVGMRINQGTRYVSTGNSSATVTGGLRLNASSGTESSDHYIYGMFVFPWRLSVMEEAMLETIPWAPTFPTLVRDGLMCWLDFSMPQSYPGSGNTVYDISNRGNDFSLVGSGWSYNPLGYLTVSSGTTYAVGPPSSAFNIQTDHTVEIICRPTNNANTIIRLLSTTMARMFYVNLPWSDNNVYYDAVAPDAGFNRVNYGAMAVNSLKHYVFRCRMRSTPNREIFESGTSMANSAVTPTNMGTNVWGGSSMLFVDANGANQWLGNFYCLRIYNRALTNQEIQTNYNIARDWLVGLT